MSETPAWLAGSSQAPAPVSSSLEISSPSPKSSGGSTQLSGAASTDDEKDLPSIILMMRLTNMGMAAAIITTAIVTMASIPPVSTFVLAIYAVCGGLLVCCLETQLKFLRVMIAVNFGFLFNSVWRFIFYLVLASTCYSWNGIIGSIMAYVTAGVAVFNTYVLCRYYPGYYRRMREKIAKEEDKRIEARISKEVKKQAVSQLTKK